jgi:hypothetical protein
VEHTTYQNLLSYNPGSVNNVRVTAERYEANLVNVEYRWIFDLDDNIPEGGMIDLIFP